MASSTDSIVTVGSRSMMDYDDKSGCSGFSSEGRRLASIAMNSRIYDDDDEYDVDTVSSSSSTDQQDEVSVDPSSVSGRDSGGDGNREVQREPNPVDKFDVESIVPQLLAAATRNNCLYSVTDDGDDDYSERYIELSWKNGAPPTVKEKHWMTPDDFDKLYAETESVEVYFKDKSSVDSKKVSRCVFCIATVIFVAAIVVLLLSMTVLQDKQIGLNGLRGDPPGTTNATEPNTSSPSTAATTTGTVQSPTLSAAPIKATPTPTALPTTSQTTEEPTLGVAVSPTGSPSAFGQDSRPNRILNFLRLVTNSTTLDEYPQTITTSLLPEEKSLVWLVEKDPMNLTLSQPVKVAQRFALAAIWFGLSGPSWKRKDDWLSGADECNWFGVTACTDDGIITGINIGGNELRGTIPVDIFAALSKLETLLLPTNKLSGTIPASMAQLSDLKQLDLRHNDLIGTIPEALYQCSLLNSVILQQNKMTGSLPASLSVLTSMETFLVDFNDLTGSVPSDYASWANIRTFRVSSNRLEGTMPAFLSWSSIETFSIYRNKFVGPLPSSIADAWPHLKTFFTGENEIGGSLPTEYARLTELRHFGVNSAKHEGTIPPQYAALSNLITFLCGNNKMTGSIPSALETWSSLSSWSCSGNAFTGNLPTAIGNWSGLKVFRMANNRLYGTIPSEISRWTELNEFNVERNDFHGSLSPAMEALNELGYFSVGGNPRLRGTIPSELGSWTDLKNVILSGTNLVGSIPWCQSSSATVKVDCVRFDCECCTCQPGPKL
jgi:Leucine-rich repeat (LRR) protein